MMATNPWTCLSTRARTLCTRAIHAGAAMVLCLGLTTTAASAAGRGDPYLQASERINNDEPIKGCDADDFIWAGGQMIEDAELVYELVLNNSAQNNSARPLLVEWAMVGEAEVELTSLLSIGDDELAAGVFMMGFLVDEEELPWLDFEPTHAAIPLDPFLLEIANEQLADARIDQLGLRVIGVALLSGVAAGEGGTLDGVWMLLVEWELAGGESGGVSMMPIGIGSLPLQEEVPEEEITLEFLAVIEKICIGGAVASIAAFMACTIGIEACKIQARQGRDRCYEKCDNNYPAPVGCPAQWMLDPDDEEDAWCYGQWERHYDCRSCCNKKHRQLRQDCKDGCGVFGAPLEFYDTCWE